TAPALPIYNPANILAMVILEGDIYLGSFGFGITETDGSSLRKGGIAKWDGLEWSFLGSGIQGQVYSLLAAGTNIYASGPIQQAGNKPANGFAIWHQPPARPDLRIYQGTNWVQVAWDNTLTNYTLETRT